MEPLRIVFFNRSYYPDTTATGQLLTELCEGLAGNHGCDVTVVAGPALVSPAAELARSHRLISVEHHNGVRILRANGTRFSKKSFAGRALNYLSYFVTAAIAGFRTGRPDVVVALTDPPIVGLAAYATARWNRARFVMAYQDIFPEVARLLEDFSSRPVERILQWINCFLARHAERNIVLGETMERRLIETKGADPATIRVIHNWADCDAIVPAPKNNPFTEKNGLAGRFVVMHSGNIGLSQSLESVVQAAALLQDLDDLRLVFVGDGVKRTALEQLVKAQQLGNVVFLPFQSKSRLTESFAAADVFVVSLKQGLSGFIVPSKVYGILAAGRPFVAATEADCEAALIANRHECGLYVPPADSAGIASAIRRLYTDPELRESLGRNARVAALSFHRTRQVSAYHTVLAELTGHPVAMVAHRA